MKKNDFDKKKCVVIDLFFGKKKNQQQLEEKSRPASDSGDKIGRRTKERKIG